MDKIALVVLSYNGKTTNEKFLFDLDLNTDPSKFSLVWIDNGSTDGTATMLMSLVQSPNRKYDMSLIANPDNLGVIGGRNLGFKAFFGETPEIDLSDCNYLVFLDNDQFVKPQWLEQHLSFLKSGYDVAGMEAWQMNQRFTPTLRVTAPDQWFSFLSGCGFSVSRKAAERIGSFDMRFNPAYFEDPDYCFRAVDLGLRLGWNYRAMVKHQPHQTLGSRADRMQILMKSLRAFADKWKGREVPRLIQTNIPSFGM